MNKIIRLDPKISNMIAAGEVVERPAGIVKELIENSIDANAHRIVIEILAGGILYIKVEDNGIGMSKEDAQLAFERHATSKITREAQLFEIKTLGFRGEALPSIAAVSSVKLTTNNTIESSEVVVHYGTFQHIRPISRNQGTTIEVRQLFQNTPARLKHLSNQYYETSKVAEVVKKFACSHPHISFCLVSENKKIFETSGNQKMDEIVAKVYDHTILKNLIQETVENEDFKLELILAQPQFTRNKNSILIYINHRMIRSYRIQKAVVEAYKNYIPPERLPIVMINIMMDYCLVDVNVHPSKQEVRISKENELITFMIESIQSLLQKQYQIPTVIEKNKENYEKLQLEFVYEVKEQLKPYIEKEEKPVVKQEVQKEVVIEKLPSIQKPQNIFHQLRVLAQLQGKYILCEHEDGLYMIDQHAAAERINYEKIQNKILKNQVQQVTLQPILISLAVDEASRIDEIVEKLNAIHIPVEIFSENSLVLRVIPDWIQKESIQQLIKDLIMKMMDDEKLQLTDLRKHAIATAACHSSIRFNRRLNMEEMQHLLIELSNCDHPYHCPHGRTVAILIENLYLEKQFMRVM